MPMEDRVTLHIIDGMTLNTYDGKGDSTHLTERGGSERLRL